MSKPHEDIAQLLGVAGARPPLPSERAERVRAAVVPAWLAAARRKRRRVGLASALAAAAAIIVVASVIHWRAAPATVDPVARLMRTDGAVVEIVSADGSRIPLATSGTVLPGQRIVSTDGRAALRLAQGTSIRIDVATDVTFLSAEQLQLDRGAVYLDSDGEASDVVVGTPLATVYEIGTRFEVRYGGDGLRIRVRDGAVRLDAGAGSAHGEAGEELWLRGDGRLERRSVRAFGPEWDWLAALASPFQLDGQTLGSFLLWLERETGWTVRFAEPSVRAELEQTVLRGPERTSNPHQALPRVLVACGLSYRLEEGTVTIFNSQRFGGVE